MSIAHTWKCATEFLTVFFIFSQLPPTQDLGDQQAVGFESLMLWLPQPLRAPGIRYRLPFSLWGTYYVYIQASVDRKMRQAHRLHRGKRTKWFFMTGELSWTEHCCHAQQGTFVISAGRGVFMLFDRTQGMVTATAAGGKASETWGLRSVGFF